MTPLSLDSNQIADSLGGGVPILTDIDREEEDLEGSSKVNRLFKKYVTSAEGLVATTALATSVATPVTEIEKTTSVPVSINPSKTVKYMATKESAEVSIDKALCSDIKKCPPEQDKGVWTNG